MSENCKVDDCQQRELRAEIERLSKIESAAKDLLRAVDKTEDHAQWFAAIGAIAHAVNQQLAEPK